MNILIALCVGFVLDLLIGDPLWLPHPVQAIGWLIVRLEKWLRRVAPATPKAEVVAGAVLVMLVMLTSLFIPWGILWLAESVPPYLRLGLECLMAWQMLAVKSLRDAAMRVLNPLLVGDMTAARQAVSMIVGRDTAGLDEKGIAHATVETVAENTADGIVAPMLFFALGGAPLAFLYKAINTMDSMVGYQNAQYRYFGRVAARLDDLANFLPARLTGLLMVVAAFLCRQRASGAWQTMRRDHQNHKSPNAAWPEAAAAGALGVQLGGTSYYGGVPVPKPHIGDAKRPLVVSDIVLTCRLSLVTAVLCLSLCLALRLLIIFIC